MQSVSWISIIMIILQIISTVVIAIIGYFVKDKFNAFKEADKANEGRIIKIEESFLGLKESFSEFKEKMPLMYTTREDQLRAQASLENRIEKLGTNMEQNFEKINTKIESKLDNFAKEFEDKVTQMGEQLNKHLQKEV